LIARARLFSFGGYESGLWVDGGDVVSLYLQERAGKGDKKYYDVFHIHACLVIMQS
jgi:hypothetical protein